MRLAAASAMMASIDSARTGSTPRSQAGRERRSKAQSLLASIGGRTLRSMLPDMTCWAAALRPDPAMRSKWRLPSKLRANQKSAKRRSGLAVRAVEAMARGRHDVAATQKAVHTRRERWLKSSPIFSLSAINRVGGPRGHRGRTPPRGAKASPSRRRRSALAPPRPALGLQRRRLPPARRLPRTGPGGTAHSLPAQPPPLLARAGAATCLNPYQLLMQLKAACKGRPPIWL